MRIYSKERDERRMIIILYFGTLVIMLILLYATYMSMRQFSEASADEHRYNFALVELSELMTDMQAQESRVLGCLLLGDTLCTLADNAIDAHRARLDSVLPEGSWKAHLTALYQSADRVRSCNRQVLLARSPGRMAIELERGGAAMNEMRQVHDRVAGSLRSAREPMLDRRRIDGFSTPIMLILYSALAIAATALLFWRVSHALSSTEKAKLDLQLKVSERDAEVVHRSTIQKMLQRVLDTSPNGIMTFQALRDEEGQIMDFLFLSTNRQANDMMGRNDLVGRLLLREMPENRHNGLFDSYVQVVETGTPFRQEIHYQGSGMDMWLADHAVRLEDGFMVTLSDITEQRRAHEVHAEADRIALTGQITRTVAHEVRNPLTNIQLAMEQLHDEVLDHEEVVRPFFEIIERNVKRIGGLINGMLESSRKRQLSLVPCKLGEVAESVLRRVSDRLELKHVNGGSDMEQDLPEVLVDRELIDLAITNIAINAVEAMEERTGFLHLRAYRSGTEVLLEVADNGKGIPPEGLARLFEPFYSGRVGGLGLGLTTTRSILNSHQIKLEVRSTLGEGTTFVLRFPSAVFAEVA